MMGKTGDPVMDAFTGSSINWQSKEVLIPTGITHIRFRYNTDDLYEWSWLVCGKPKTYRIIK